MWELETGTQVVSRLKGGRGDLHPRMDEVMLAIGRPRAEGGLEPCG